MLSAYFEYLFRRPSVADEADYYRMMNNETNDIHLAFSFDQNYIRPFFVLLTSIFASNPGERFQLHVVLTNASASEKASITDFVEVNNSCTSFYDIEVGYIQSFAPPSERYGLATFYRLLLPKMLSADVRKFIYFDIDIVVVGQLRELFATEMGLYPLAAVPEPVDYARPDLGLHEVGSYFNAGVLLINLAAWQQQRVAERAIRFLRDSPEKAVYLDQDALNAVLVHNWLPLSDQFNFTWRSIPHVAKQELRVLVHTKTVIHFNTALKPWHRFSNGRLDYLYHEYFDLSPISSHGRYHPVKVTRLDVKNFIFGRLSNLYLNNAFFSKHWRRFKRLLSH